jgi:hypothetical protein
VKQDFSLLDTFFRGFLFSILKLFGCFNVHKYLLICVCVCTPTARLHGQQRQGHHHHHPGLGLAMHAARLPPCVETEVTGVAPRCPSA